MLEPTRFLDHDHPAVSAFAEESTKGRATPRERACHAFAAVRDRIRYDPYQAELAPADLSASATIARGSAFCVPKAILLAAVLRKMGIPTQLGFADVTNHLASERLLARMRTNVFAFHGYVLAHLDGRALKVTPAFDAALCARFGVPPLDWDGENDAMLQPFAGDGRAFLEYVKDRGVHDDLPYDEMMRVWREVYPHIHR